MNRQAVKPSHAVGIADADTSTISSAALYREIWSPGVLVVDGDGGVRGHLERGLRESGFEVWSCSNGRDAVELLREHGGSIDVALIEVLMPDRDGPKTLADLRAIDPNLRAGFLTEAFGRSVDRGLFYLGAQAIFWKPIDLDQLVGRLRFLATPAFR